MRNLIRILTLTIVGAPALAGLFANAAESTFGDSDTFSWSANTGWIDWNAGGKPGAVIGEYVCSGYLYGANIGWIHLGSGIPGSHPSVPNAPYYSNTSATDYGLNLLASGLPFKANLRGMAWGANVGWIAFEATGNPQVDLLTGHFSGYAWGANIGWINLGEEGVSLRTEKVVPGIDTDGDGIADSWELLHAGNLTAMNETSDSSGDGWPDLYAYRAGVDPFDPEARLRIIDFSLLSEDEGSLTWTSVPTRLYRIESSPTLEPGTWSILEDFIEPSGPATHSALRLPEEPRQFFRVQAFRPLAP